MDRSQTDPNWPIEYPAIVRQDFTPNSNIPGFIAARKDDEVKVTSKVDSNGNICIQYPVNEQKQPGRRGWVARSILQVGKQRQIGDPMLVGIGEPYWPHLAQKINPQQGTLLYRTVVGLVSSYYEHREDLPTKPYYTDRHLKTDQLIRKFAVKIMSGVTKVSKTISGVLNSGNFTILDIRNASWDASTSRKIGIYVIAYSDYPAEPNRVDIYVGSTSASFEDRYKSHVSARRKTNPKGVHYRSAAKARRHQIFPICLLEDLDPDQGDLKIAEQVFVDLLQTTCESVLNFQYYHDTDDDLDGIPQSGTNGALLSRVAKYIVDKEEACILLNLAEQVFSRTGWLGGVRRTEDKSFGATAGLNWSMPLTELQYSRTTWVKTSVPGKYMNFRRTGNTVRYSDGRKILFQKSRSNGPDFAFFLEQNLPGPDYGTNIHAIFEIRVDGQSHPCQLARAPTTGCFDDWFDATTLALRIEWQDRNGAWMYRYVQLDNSYNHIVTGATNGATLGYTLATCLRAFFLHETRKPTDKFPWVYDFGWARLKEISVDHLSQTIVVAQPHNPRPGPAIRKRTFDEIGQELVSLGATRYAKDSDDTFPKFRAGAKLTGPKGGKPRKSCDHCHAGRLIVSS